MNRRDLIKRIFGLSAIAGSGVRVSTKAEANDSQTVQKPPAARRLIDVTYLGETANHYVTKHYVIKE